jgi:hypothetical protein
MKTYVKYNKIQDVCIKSEEEKIFALFLSYKRDTILFLDNSLNKPNVYTVK